MQQLLTYLRIKIKTWQERRFLKRHGCDSWEQYNYRFDPDIFKPASRIRDYYRGYPYFYCFENHKHEVYDWDIHIDGIYVLSKWCKKNCKDKFRFDFHRAMKAPATANEWEINELGGGDYIFVAFKEQRDYTWFILRWN
jgi:hypothetical protein